MLWPMSYDANHNTPHQWIVPQPYIYNLFFLCETFQHERGNKYQLCGEMYSIVIFSMMNIPSYSINIHLFHGGNMDTESYREDEVMLLDNQFNSVLNINKKVELFLNKSFQCFPFPKDQGYMSSYPCGGQRLRMSTTCLSYPCGGP